MARRKSRKVRQRTGTTRLTKRYARKRVRQPSAFKKGSFRTLRAGKGGKKIIVGRLKRSGKSKIQAVLTPRKK